MTKKARRILGNLADDGEKTVAEMIHERGGTAANVREAGHWATELLGRVAEAAAVGDAGAVKAIKIVKNARRLGMKRRSS